jgi:hypothetical protein
MSGSGQGSSCCRLLAVATLLLASTGSRAATYFECRDAGGGILYSDLPCPDGDRQATTEVRREVAADNVALPLACAESAALCLEDEDVDEADEA